MFESILIIYAIVILGLAVWLWDTNHRATRAIAILDDVDVTLETAIRKLAEEREEAESKLRADLRKQEELIAMLWYDRYGMEPAEEGRYVPSGRLTKVYGLRPYLKVSDPMFVTDRNGEFSKFFY